MGVVASLVLAISLGAMIFGFTGLYARRLLAHNLGAIRLPTSRLIWRTLPIFILFSIVSAVWTIIVLNGFAEGIASDIRIGRIFRGRFDDDHFRYLLVCIAPIAVHYLMVVYSSATAKPEEMLAD